MARRRARATVPRRGLAGDVALHRRSTCGRIPPPLIVGERSNANGSKKFREGLLREDFDSLVEIGREQIAEGAHLIDVCTPTSAAMKCATCARCCAASTQINLPLVIDTTQLDVLEAALKMIGGRAIINSVNLEDGEEKANQIAAWRASTAPASSR